MADGIIHRDIFEPVEARLVQIPDPVARADPDLAVDVLKTLHIGQRRDVPDVQGGEVVLEAAVIHLGVFPSEVQISRLCRVREDADDPLDAALVRADEAVEPAEVQRKQISDLREAVDQAVGAEADVADIGLRKPAILQSADVHAAVDHADARRGGDIHGAFRVLRDGTDVDGRQTVRHGPVPKRPLLHDEHARIVCPDPQAVPAVHIQGYHA